MDAAEKLRNLMNRATPGPWKGYMCDGPNAVHLDSVQADGQCIAVVSSMGVVTGANALFIAAVRNDLPKVLDELDALRLLFVAEMNLSTWWDEHGGECEAAEEIELHALEDAVDVALTTCVAVRKS